MRNIKDFQARYDRWKNGERYWDIRGVELPKYDTANKNTDQQYIFQRPNGTYYSSPTNSSAFTEDVTPVLKRNLSDASTWDFVGSNTGKRYNTQYTDEQLKQMAYNSMPNAEMVTWVDRAGNKQRSPKVVGLSPADPVASFVVENAAGLPAWKALGYAGNKLAVDFARDFAFTKFGNWTRNKILSKELNNVVDNTYKGFSVYNPFVFANNFIPKQKGFGEIELIPLANSQFDNYAHNIYDKLNKSVEYPEIRLVNADDLSPGVVGLYDPQTKIARISQKDTAPLSTAIHEAISHHTDPYVENLPVRNFVPGVNTSATVGDVYRFLGQQGSQFHKLPGSSNWYEVRATLNELRGNSPWGKTNIDDVHNDEILTALRDVNGYGGDYYNAILKSSPEQNNRWFDLFRAAWKYLPAIAPPLIQNRINHEKEK